MVPFYPVEIVSRTYEYVGRAYSVWHFLPRSSSYSSFIFSETAFRLVLPIVVFKIFFVSVTNRKSIYLQSGVLHKWG